MPLSKTFPAPIWGILLLLFLGSLTSFVAVPIASPPAERKISKRVDRLQRRLFRAKKPAQKQRLQRKIKALKTNHAPPSAFLWGVLSFLGGVFSVIFVALAWAMSTTTAVLGNIAWVSTVGFWVSGLIFALAGLILGVIALLIHHQYPAPKAQLGLAIIGLILSGGVLLFLVLVPLR